MPSPTRRGPHVAVISACDGVPGGGGFGSDGSAGPGRGSPADGGGGGGGGGAPPAASSAAMAAPSAARCAAAHASLERSVLAVAPSARACASLQAALADLGASSLLLPEAEALDADGVARVAQALRVVPTAAVPAGRESAARACCRGCGAGDTSAVAFALNYCPFLNMLMCVRHDFDSDGDFKGKVGAEDDVVGKVQNDELSRVQKCIDILSEIEY